MSHACVNVNDLSQDRNSKITINGDPTNDDVVLYMQHTSKPGGVRPKYTDVTKNYYFRYAWILNIDNNFIQLKYNGSNVTGAFDTFILQPGIYWIERAQNQHTSSTSFNDVGIYSFYNITEGRYEGLKCYANDPNSDKVMRLCVNLTQPTEYSIRIVSGTIQKHYGNSYYDYMIIKRYE